MKTIICLMIFSVILLSGTGCEDSNSGSNRKIIGTGPVITKILDLPPFSSVDNTGVANINVVLGTPQSVELMAQQNIMDVMTYEVIDNVLKIGLEKNVSIEHAEEILFNITIPALNKIELEGVSDFTLSGDYQDEMTIILTGVGNVKAYDLNIGICNITLTGVGICEVMVMDKLNVTIVGVGNVYYKGDPDIISNVTGVGRLINANK